MLINSYERQDGNGALCKSLPHTGHVVMNNGGSEKLWEIPKGCFVLGWVLVANSMANSCKNVAKSRRSKSLLSKEWAEGRGLWPDHSAVLSRSHPCMARKHGRVLPQLFREEFAEHLPVPPENQESCLCKS